MNSNKKGYVVCTLTKVGSITIYRSINKNIKEYFIETKHGKIRFNNHIHSLKYPEKSHASLKERFDHGNHTIICSIRNPLHRNLSYFLHALNINKKNSFDDVKLKTNDYKGNEMHIKQYTRTPYAWSSKELYEIYFNTNFLFQDIEWYNQFFSILEFDIKKHTFDKKKGLQVYQLKNNNTLVLLTLEKLNNNKTELANILHIPAITDYNSSHKKHYYKLYKSMKQNIKYSQSHLLLLHNDIMEFVYEKEYLMKLQQKYF